jgi:hypothetical protein
MAKKDEKTDAADALEQPVDKTKYDETIPGGKYAHPDGGFQNAHGQRIDEEGHVIDGSSVPVVEIPAQFPPPTQ